jgi:hypothetical protein
MTIRVQPFETDLNVDYRTAGCADSLFKCKGGAIRARRLLI